MGVKGDTMKKRIEHYILNEPWEERFDRLVGQIERRVIDPFLVCVAIYVVGLALMALVRG